MNKLGILIFLLIIIFVIWNFFSILFAALAAYYFMLRVLAIIGILTLAFIIFNYKRE